VRRKLLTIVVFGALLATAGCMAVTVDSSVNADGTIETYDVEMAINNSVYPQMESQAQAAGYDSFGEFFLAENASVDRSNVGNVNITEQPGVQNTTVHIELSDYDPGPGSNISVSEEGGMLVYEDRTFGTQSESTPTPTQEGPSMDFGQSMSGSIEYRLEMPGAVQSASEGGTIDGNVVTWDIEGQGELYVSAESEIPESSDGDGGDGGDGGGSSGFGPGVGPVGVLVALALVVVALRRRAN
jgi:hypothetical protein